MSDGTTSLLALPGLRVLDVAMGPDGGRVVLIDGAEAEGGCSVSSADYGAEQLWPVSPFCLKRAAVPPPGGRRIGG